ncbi:MAG TPA: response regulator transcription factor [Planctomycetota bacterium]|nr:response regulator transcription factor [Planctomycetota bacterium]
MSIRVLLADDHKIMRDGLRALLDKVPDVEVVAEAENGRDAVELARTLKPNVIIMDMSMPELNGIEATRQVLADNSKVRVIALSMHSDKRFLSQVFRAGAVGYLLKDCAFDELSRAVQTINAGEKYLSPKLTNVVVDNFMRPSSLSLPAVSTKLTPREREVIQLIAEGESTKEIAARLHVSVKTIETHRSQIMHKLGMHSIAQLTKFAIREGLTSLDL